MDKQYIKTLKVLRKWLTNSPSKSDIVNAEIEALDWALLQLGGK